MKLFKFTKNIEKIHKGHDIFCFPSHLNSPGRSVFEAGFYSVLSIAAISNPCNDTFEDGKTGLIVKMSNFKDLANKNFNAKVIGKNFYLNIKK